MMGAIHVDVTISNFADRSRSWTGRFLVDTGATDTVIPRNQLDAIGITPERQRLYELADGREAFGEVEGMDGPHSWPRVSRALPA